MEIHLVEHETCSQTVLVHAHKYLPLIQTTCKLTKNVSSTAPKDKDPRLQPGMTESPTAPLTSKSDVHTGLELSVIVSVVCCIDTKRKFFLNTLLAKLQARAIKINEVMASKIGNVTTYLGYDLV